MQNLENPDDPIFDEDLAIIENISEEQCGRKSKVSYFCQNSLQLFSNVKIICLFFYNRKEKF